MNVSPLNERNSATLRLAHVAIQALARSEALEHAIRELERTHGICSRSLLMDAAFRTRMIVDQTLDHITHSDRSVSEWLREGMVIRPDAPSKTAATKSHKTRHPLRPACESR